MAKVKKVDSLKNQAKDKIDAAKTKAVEIGKTVAKGAAAAAGGAIAGGAVDGISATTGAVVGAAVYVVAKKKKNS
ncbi:ComC/BlpC family peptide pheromone/bacteriocin [Shimazuella alba]|uniref:ComC/BlpC family peptide pheromone/bacteriocin n=1 Tax=Shimazuella alba TaxID=2690964 RepID=A0A6I4VZZ6_9BACL|nr:ComC/BlpC family peptide pheromone/bacteriocin [Shimazuella alba]MXQ53642.1 ComC/BlpC family peptide pheromone/bacteriocin [Shimazuella alba]